MKDLGIKELRVRHFGGIARIEVNGEDRIIISNNFELIKKKFNEIGFNEIIISNFRSGNLNVVLNVQAEN